MRSLILSIGDELLIGQVINTNAAFIANEFQSIGLHVDRILTVGDNETAILKAMEEAYLLVDVIAVTGGLGPTHDDITRGAMCKFFHTDLVSSDEAREEIKLRMKERNVAWSDAAENQTLIPRSAKVIPNHRGTAPGELFERDNKYVVVMPGVPDEMQAMMKNHVVPFLASRVGGNVILHRTLRTTGIAESQLAQRLGNLSELLRGASLAFLPYPSGVQLRITISGSDGSQCERELAAIERSMRARIEKYIYGIDDLELEEAVGTILRERHLRIAVAESCTGGMIAFKLTNVPGSSQYFERGLVAYSNQSKIDSHLVTEDLLGKHGAVSKEVAEAMARSVRTSTGVDIGISTTGIAGPGGGTEEKPIGLVWIGYSDLHETIAMKFHFGGDRHRIRERATQSALDLVRRKLLKIV